MVDCTGLENRRTERFRGFESHPLRLDNLEYRLLMCGEVAEQAEGNGLLIRRRGAYPYRGFESLPLRHFFVYCEDSV